MFLKLVVSLAFGLVTFHAGAQAIDEEGLRDAFLNPEQSEQQEQVQEDFISEEAVGPTRTLTRVDVGPELRRYPTAVADCGQNLTHVKLAVLRSPLYLGRVGVTFTDGGTKEHTFGEAFSAGYESAWVNLALFRPGNRCVKSFFVDARSAVPGHPAQMEVMGRFLQ